MDIAIDVAVNRPVEEVFEYLSDFRNENEWNVVSKNTRLLSSGPVGIGSRFAGDYERMGAMNYEILEFERPRWLKVRGSSKQMDWVSTFQFKETGSGTTVHGTMAMQPTGFMRVLAPLMGGMVKSQTAKGMESFKATMEGKPATPFSH